MITAIIANAVLAKGISNTAVYAALFGGDGGAVVLSEEAAKAVASLIAR